MSAAALRNRYLGDTVSTASPQRLLVMLYDRLALDLERAETATAAGDRELSNELLQHAQEIVQELQSSLQIDSWEGAPRLSALYTWLHGELVKANIRQNARIVADCRKVVEPLQDAWRAAAASLASSPE
jgi:flagellar protein FliS